MNTNDQIGLAVCSEPRCAALILADASGSMSGRPIKQLNAGLQTIKEHLVNDQLACLRVELALVSFQSSAKVDVDFVSPELFNPPPLVASGETYLGAAVITALDLLKARVQSYRAAGLSCYRPWLLLITDAEATDSVTEAAERIKQGEASKQLSFFPIGVPGADFDQLSKLSVRPPLKLEGLDFPSLFEWLSINLSSVAVSRPGDQVTLTDPTWASI